MPSHRPSSWDSSHAAFGDRSSRQANGIAPCAQPRSTHLHLWGGVGTEPGYLPDGVAMFVPAGIPAPTQSAPVQYRRPHLTGRSGTRGRSSTREGRPHRRSHCRVDRSSWPFPRTFDATGHVHVRITIPRFIECSPHMHQTGVHMKIGANSSERGPCSCTTRRTISSPGVLRLGALTDEKGRSSKNRVHYENPTGRTLRGARARMTRFAWPG